MRQRGIKAAVAALAVLVLVAAALGSSASAAETAIVSVVGPGHSVAPGEAFTVEIVVEPNGPIAGMQFDLLFDPSLIAVGDVQEGGLLTQDGAESYFVVNGIDNDFGFVSGVAGAVLGRGESVSSTGTFAAITCEAGIVEGVCSLALENVMVANMAGELLPVSLVHGQIVVDDGIVDNQPPVLDPIGDKSVTEGDLLEFVVSGGDPDGDAVTYSASNLPEGATFDAATGAFSWTPGYAQAGAYSGIRFEVDDGELSHHEEITITVEDRNRAPVLESVGDRSVNQGQELRVVLRGSDPDGDKLTYSASNLPSGAIFYAATGEFAWVPDRAGIFRDVRFQVSDGALADSEDITIIVNAVNAPAASGGGGGGAVVGGGGGGSVPMGVSSSPLPSPTPSPANPPSVTPTPPPVPTPPPAPTIAAPLMVWLEDGESAVEIPVEAGGFLGSGVAVWSPDRLCEISIGAKTKCLGAAGDPLTQVSVERRVTPPALPAGDGFLGAVYDLGPDGAVFDPPILLALRYDDDLLPEGVAETDLTISTWDEASGEWYDLKSTVNASENVVIADVSHFSTYAILVSVPEPVAVSPPQQLPVPSSAGDRGGDDGAAGADEVPTVEWSMLGKIIGGALGLIMITVVAVLVAARRRQRLQSEPPSLG